MTTVLNVQSQTFGTAKLAAAQAEFDGYLKTVIEHDPGATGTIMFFGLKGGIERDPYIFN